jgi:lipoate-protein ligase B
VSRPPALLVADLGTLPYAEALALQRAVARARIGGAVDEDVLLLVEHPPVVTLGRSTKAQHLTTPAELLAARGVELHEVERGGDVTFHGPGQLVGYPILDLKRHRRDLHWYLRQVEEALIRGVGAVGVVAGRNAGFTGVWVDTPRAGPAAGGGSARAPRKLASIGVHARDWVTWHGFALNVTTDLSYFDLIVPCGISGVTMTSVAEELRPAHCTASLVQDAVVESFGAVFALAPIPLAARALEAMLPVESAVTV